MIQSGDGRIAPRRFRLHSSRRRARLVQRRRPARQNRCNPRGLMSPPVRPGIRYGSKRIVEPYAGLQEQ